MHTKPKNLLKVNSLAKHWAFKINPDVKEFIKFYSEKSNYENLLSQEEITKEAVRVYSWVPKTSYGVETFPSLRVRISLTSERDEYFVEVNGRDLADLKNNIQEFLTDYQNSIFIIKRVMTRIMHTQYQWDLMPEQESQEVAEVFQNVIEVENSNYKAEVKRIQGLQRKDDFMHKMQGFSFEYALFHKLLLIGLMTCLGLNIMRENYWLTLPIIIAVVAVFRSHQKKVEKQQIQGMFRDLKNLDKKS